MIGNFSINGTHIRKLGFNTLRDSSIKSPTPKIKQVEIDGSSEVFDTTEYGGFVSYERGEIVTTIGGKFAKNLWPSKISQLSRLVNGKQCKLIFDRDPGYFYIGRGKMVPSLTASRVGSIQIVWTCDPYKYEISDGSEQEWDTVDLIDGVFREYPATEVSGSAVFEIVSRDKQVALEIEFLDDGDPDWPYNLGDIYVSHADSPDAKQWRDRTNLGPEQPYEDEDGVFHTGVFEERVVLPEFLFGGNTTHYVKVEGDCKVQLHYRGGVLY